MTIQMNDQEDGFKLLKHLILRATKLNCGQYKDKYLKRRIGVRMRACNCRSYEQYIRLLKNTEGEVDRLIQTITINVTEFFRDPDVFKVLGEEVFPEIVYQKVHSERRVFRIWSAGCSTGQEPYSLAVLAHTVLGKHFDQFLVSIHGTDVDDVVLDFAKRGVYPSDILEAPGGSLLEPYLEVNGPECRFNQTIRQMVRFRKLDLLGERNPRNFDLILNRNVMIYFDKPHQEVLLDRFHKALNDDGYLVLGKTEGLFGTSRDLFTIVDGRRRIYQKKVDERWGKLRG